MEDLEEKFRKEDFVKRIRLACVYVFLAFCICIIGYFLKKQI